YDDALPWPQSPDGDGPTLELVSPALDNSDAANWRASAPSAPHGTPGAENSVYTPAEEPEPPEIVRDWQIVNVYPNPFNSETRIELLAPRAERTAIMIYDILGRVTQTIPLRTAPGLQSVVWSGNTSEGALAASGIYFIRIGNRETSTLRKVVLLR
ncbi:T9SS type A sorting domain-containing protein, partial [bacterium]|nr:T9SS type A sorting domain-containing protein [bacterium]